MKQAVEVKILGRQFFVKSEAAPTEVRRVADFVNSKVEEVVAAGRSADTLGCALLALMNISGAYLLLQDQVAVAKSDEVVRTRLQALLERIEQADFGDAEGGEPDLFAR